MTETEVTTGVYHVQDDGRDGLVMAYYCALCRWDGTDGTGPCEHKRELFPQLHYHNCGWRGCDRLTTSELCPDHAVLDAEMDADRQDAYDAADVARQGF